MFHTPPPKKDKDNIDEDKKLDEDKNIKEEENADEARNPPSFINTRLRRTRKETISTRDLSTADLQLNQLYTRFNQPFDEEIPTTSSAVELYDSFSSKTPPRPKQSLVIIEDLKTNQIFASPGRALSRSPGLQKLNFEEYIKGKNPFFNRTERLENPELLSQLFNDEDPQIPNFVPIYKFPKESFPEYSRSSILRAIENCIKDAKTFKRTIKKPYSKKSLELKSTSGSSSSSDTENSDSDTEDKSDMTLKIGDILTAIPTFDGSEKDLDTFMNVCQSFDDLLDNDQKEQLPGLIKMRIVGRALARIQPTNELDTWARIKAKLEKTFKKPLTYELAQYELAMIKQKRNESIEQYAERIRNGLEKLNTATQGLTKDEGALLALQCTNDKQALQHFEQNIFNDDLRIRVDSANKSTLGEAISFAKQKEISLKLNTTKTCDFCKMTGHEIADCRRKNFNQSQPGNSGQRYRNDRSLNTNRYNSPFNGTYDSRYNNSNNNNNGRFNNNTYNGSRYNNNYNNNRYGNYGNNSYNNNNGNYRNNYGNNNNGHNGNRNETLYRDNRTQNYGYNGNGRNGPQEQRGYYRNNNGNNNGNNTRNNSENSNSRNNFGDNNTRQNNDNNRPPNNQNNRGNARSVQVAEEMDLPITTAAQIHEKN